MGSHTVKLRVWWSTEGGSGDKFFTRRKFWDVEVQVPERFVSKQVEPAVIRTETGETCDPLPGQGMER
jgi:hypothetical protein